MLNPFPGALGVERLQAGGAAVAAQANRCASLGSGHKTQAEQRSQGSVAHQVLGGVGGTGTVAGLALDPGKCRPACRCVTGRVTALAAPVAGLVAEIGTGAGMRPLPPSGKLGLMTGAARLGADKRAVAAELGRITGDGRTGEHHHGDCRSTQRCWPTMHRLRLPRPGLAVKSLSPSPLDHRRNRGALCQRPIRGKRSVIVTRVIGLTGGIASGKSTAAAMLRELGAPLIDADELAREVVEPGTPALAEIVARWGSGVLAPDGQLDRKKLGALVFADESQRKELNRITHPRIAAAAQERLAALRQAGAPAVVYEAALIVENQLHRGMNGLIVVSVPPDVQQRRLMQRDGLSEDEAEARLRAQLPLANKIAVATHVIDNSGTLQQTRSQVQNVWKQINESIAP
jgi:dephospho-CoA kinase